jgi:putative ABC transport system permease protein
MTWRMALLVFRTLLRAFPAPFRQLYAADMESCFRERWRASPGRALRLRLLIATTVDLAASAAAEQWRSSLNPPEAREPAFTNDPTHRPGGLVSVLLNDVRYAFRSLRRQPGFALFVILTLGVGIGANTAVFTVVNRVLLTPLRLPESERLVAVWGRFDPESGFDFPQFPLSAPEFVDYRAQSRAMADVAAWEGHSLTVGGAEPERVRAAAVTDNFFSLLRVQPAHGRPFSAEEGQPGGPRVVLLGFGYWHSRFGADPAAVGRTIVINNASATIIGILPDGFSFPGTDTRIWTPLRIDAGNPGNRQAHSIRAIGRLAPGASLESAHAEIQTLMAGWRAQYPDVHTGHYLFLRSLLDDVAGSVRQALILLLGATGFVLLIVCANIATAVLARGEARGREMAIRGALGAGRSRLVLLSLAESTLLAAAGGLLGLALAHAGVVALVAMDPTGIPRSAELGLDWQMAACALALSIASAIFFGLVPAVRGSTAELQSTLRESAHALTGGVGRQWTRWSLVALEVALAVVLVIGAGLMLRSFDRLLSVDPGFAAGNLLAAGVSLPVASYREPERVETFYASLLDRIHALPGVRSATASSGVPLWSDTGVWDFDIEGQPEPAPGEMAWNAGITIVRRGFFETLGIPVVRGRAFTDRDDARGMPVTVINETMAARFFPGADPIGRRIRIAASDSDRAWMTIVGISGDIRDTGLDTAPRPLYYLLQSQMPGTTQGSARSMSLIVRVDGEPEAVAGGIRDAVRQLDSSLPVFDVQSLDTIIDRSVARPRFTTMLLALFAVVGIVLGASGVYGVLAYTVARRTHEIGIRRALGAPPSAVVADVVGRAMRPVLAGLAAGLVASFWTMRLLEAQLFGISGLDVPTYAVVAAGIIVIALAASAMPARRAMKVDALVAMRVA